MYLMYVDESGDSGLVGSPTRYFALTGMVIHELRWKSYLDILIQFRKEMRTTYGLRLLEEFHAADMITKPGLLLRIKKNDRLSMIRHFADRLAQMTDINLVNVIVDKNGKGDGYDAFEAGWKCLLQRFENTVNSHNFRGPANPDERGLIVADNTDNKKLVEVMRKMRVYNPIPHQPRFGTGYRNLPIQYVIEDANFRESLRSYFIQAADLCVFLLYQREQPNKYIKKHGAHNYFLKLRPLFCLQASPSDPNGIVRL